MNRPIIDTDKKKYEEFLAPNEEEIKDGDLVFDYWAVNAQGVANKPGVVGYTFFTASWGNKIKDGGTIWIDCDAYNKLGGIKNFALTNDSDKTSKLWPIESVRVKLIPNAQLNVRVDPLITHGGYLFQIGGGIKFPTFSAGSKQFPGHYRDQNDPRVFTRDLFGINLDGDGDLSGRHLLAMDSDIDGGRIKLDGIAGGGGGFTVLRLDGGQIHRKLTGEIVNCYFYRPKSETVYLGSTQAAPWAQFEDFLIKDTHLDNSGTESLQLGHLAGNCHIQNVLITGCGSKYFNPFQNWQMGTNQIQVDRGNNSIKKLILDGCGSGAFTLFGTNGYNLPAGIAKGPDPGDTFLIEDFHINNVDGNFMYLHNAASAGIKWIFRRGTVSNFDNEFAENTGAPVQDSFVSPKVGKDEVIFDDVTFDKSRAKIFSNPANFPNANVKTVDKVPPVIYYNRGYKGQVKTWFTYYANFLPNADFTPTRWKKDQLCMDNGVGLQTRWCKSLMDHSAKTFQNADGSPDLTKELRPRDNPTQWLLLTWDAKGKPSDEPGWDSASPQRIYPPDDNRIVSPEHKHLWFNAPGPTKENITEQFFEGDNRITKVGERTYRENLETFKA